MITTEIKRDCVYKQRSDVPSHSKDPNGLQGANALQLRNFLRAENWEGLRLLIVDCVHDVKGLADAHLPHRVNTARGLFVSCYAQHHRYTEP